MAENIKEDSGKKKKTSRKKIVIIVLILMILAAGGSAAYLFILSKNPVKISTSDLPVEMVAFCFEKLPSLYETLLALNEEITLTQNEITRIGNVGSTYPDQKKIADSETKSWAANLTALKKSQAEFEKQIEILYVSYRVNPETGQVLMDEKKDALKEKVDVVVTQSKTMTDKLRAIAEARSFFEKTRDRIF